MPSAGPSIVVDVWTIALDAPRPNLLSPDEETRAARFLFEADRTRWAHARSALRAILADYLHTAPDAIVFTEGVNGKPAARGAEFNISHSREQAMIAVTREIPVGIDLEQIRNNVDIGKLLRRIGESDADAGGIPELFQRWTRREARTKALGGQLMDTPAGDLRVTDLMAPAGFAASLALLGADPMVNYRGGV